jgi:phosphomannomutase
MKTKYFFTPSIDVSKKVFDEIRNYKDGEMNYPKSLSEEFKIKSVRDLTIGYDNSQSDNKPILPIDPTSQMITFTFEDGSTATIRSSGTEPKIKWYTEVNCDEKEKTLEKLERLKNLVIEKLLQPEKFNLVPPKE